jgi:hypothetical protein
MDLSPKWREEDSLMGGGGLQKWENSKGRLAGKKGQKKRVRINPLLS